MASSQQTPYLGLSNFSDTDKPTFRGDWNNDNSKIDANAKKVADQLSGIGSRVENVSSTCMQAVREETVGRQDADSELNKALEAETARATSSETALKNNIDTSVNQLRGDFHDIDNKIVNTDREINALKNAGPLYDRNLSHWSSFIVAAENASCGFAENSREGITYCRDNNIVPQVDVRLLRDGTPVLHSDVNLGRTEYLPTDIAEHSDPLGTLANLDEYHKFIQYPYTPGGCASTPISLEECFQILDHNLIFIHLADNNSACFTRVKALIDRYHMQSYVFLCMRSLSFVTQDDINDYHICRIITNNNDVDNTYPSKKPFAYLSNYNFSIERDGSLAPPFDTLCADGTKLFVCDISHQTEYRLCSKNTHIAGIISYRPDYITNNTPITGQILGKGRGATCRPHEHNNSGLTWDTSEKQGLFLAGESFGFRGAYSDNKWNAVIEPYELRDLTLANDGHIDFNIRGQVSESSRTNWDDDFIKIVAWMDSAADTRFLDASPDYDKLIWHADRYGGFGLWGGIGKPIKLTEYISTVNGQPASQSNPNKTSEMGWGFSLNVSFTESEMSFNYNDDHISAFQSNVNFSPHLLSTHVNFAIVLNAACRLTFITADYNYLPGRHGSPGRVAI